MLQSIHDNAKGWIAYAIVLLISVPFALWGIQEYIGGGGKSVVAVVNGEDIELQAVQNEVTQQRQRIATMLGKIPPGFDEKMMRTSALESLINQTLLKQHAKENGYRASTQEVASLIQTIPQFQKNGVFDRETYQQIMALQGRSRVAFEQQIRSSLTEDQFRNAIAETAFLPNAEIKQYQALDQQKRDVELYTLKVNDAVADVQVTDEMVEKEYKDNPQLFQTDEQVRVAYVELNKDDISKDLEVTDELLQAYYAENDDRYRESAKFKMSHIKVAITDTQTEASAKAKADVLYQQILSGEKSFEEIAAITDDETLFSESGDVIGFLKAGSKEPSMIVIEDTVATLKPGEVSKPVKTPSGYEIIKLIDYKVEKQKSYQEAKSQVEKEYRNEKAQERYEDLFESLRTTSFENDGSLEPAASAIGVAIKTTPFFSRKGGASIAANSDVISAAFSPEVLSQGVNSGIIELSATQAVVLRVDAHKEPELKPLADVKADIEMRLKQEQARKRVKEKGDELLASVKSAGNWSALGDAASAVEKYAAVKRNDGKIPGYVNHKVFQLPPPESGKPQFTGAESPVGDYSIIALTAVVSGDTKIDEASRSEYSSYIGNRLQAATLKALRDQSDIEINIEQLSSE